MEPDYLVQAAQPLHIYQSLVVNQFFYLKDGTLFVPFLVRISWFLINDYR